MSAQHTQARLEVEDATNEDGRVYLTIKGKRLALGAVFNLQMRGNTLNDARRLAACWNACEGLPTDLLENITMMGDTLHSRFRLREQTERELIAQRDALLAALTRIRALPVHADAIRMAHKHAEDAIAKVAAEKA